MIGGFILASGKGSTATNTKAKTTRKTTSKTTGSRKTGTGKKAGRPAASSVKNKTSRSGTSTTQKRAAGQKNKADYERLEKERMFRNEIAILISAALSLFLFCSNLHWCGIIGEFFYRLMCGSMGILGYVFPVYITAAVSFILLKRGSFKVRFKMIAAAVLYWALCGITEISFGGRFDKTLPLMDYYYKGIEGRGGGLAGGIIAKGLVPNISFAGTVILMMVLILIAVVFISEHSIVEPIGKKSSKMYHDAKGDFDRHRIERKRYIEEVKETEKRRYYQPSLKNDRAEDKKHKDETAFEDKPVFKDKPVSEDKNIPENNSVSENKPAFENNDDTNKIFLNAGNRERMSRIDRFEITIGEEKEQEPADKKPENAPDDWYKDDETVSYDDIVSYDDTVFDINEENEIPDELPATKEIPENPDTVTVVKESAPEQTKKPEELKENKPAAKKKPYIKPPVRLLARQERYSSGMSKEMLTATAMKLQQTLRDFGVGVTVTNYSCGPAVTRYELQPDHGVKVSRIVSLADDIKLNLAAADIRIEAPIPGKSVVGIEVPNKENSTVYFRNVIESNEFCNHPSKLAFAVGKDIGGNNIIADLAKMPHLLIAGATGSGKSVCINTLIMSILYKATPEEVQLIMIDPKVVELSVYNGIPHLKYPVVTDPKLASGALGWAVSEMMERYDKFAEYSVRDIVGYNKKVEKMNAEGKEAAKLPQIVIIVDELADLMMVAPGEVEDSICRLAQMARAAGLHLVIATQRPSVNVITGLIKANVPSRIAFSVSSGVDSRTIIDMNGAEKLLGRGDMLFYPSGYQKPIRVQGAFVSDNEVAKVVEFLSGNSQPEYDKNITEAINKFSSQTKEAKAGAESVNGYDEYFVKAGKFIIEKNKASIGMLQRVFKIGFNRAGRIMDQLTEAGVVGEEQGTKPREVIMSMEQFENFIEEYL